MGFIPSKSYCEFTQKGRHACCPAWREKEPSLLNANLVLVEVLTCRIGAVVQVWCDLHENAMFDEPSHAIADVLFVLVNNPREERDCDSTVFVDFGEDVFVCWTRVNFEFCHCVWL